MGKGGSAKTSADTTYAPQVTTTSHVDVGVSEEALVHIVDIIETANLARETTAKVLERDLQPVTSFVPQTSVASVPTTGGGGGQIITIAAIGLALAGAMLLLRRRS